MWFSFVKNDSKPHKILKMKKLIQFLFLSLVIFSCKNDEDSPSNSNLTLSIKGLEDLGPNFVYEGWLLVNGNAISSGRFTVDGKGKLSQEVFPIPAASLNAATTFVLTVEPATNDLPAPTDIHVLAGDFSGKTGVATVSHRAALGNDFSTAAGKYLLATPTDGGSMDNEQSGIWFMDNSGANPTNGLTLPTLPSGWIYEGWVVINGVPLSTGTFLRTTGADNNAATSTFKGTANNGPAFPGEDFLRNAPSGLSFPADLKGKTVVVSIEPVPDNSPAPFVLKPLANTIPANAAVHTVLSMSKNLESFPTGTFAR
jgi:hypothetical protein